MTWPLHQNPVSDLRYNYNVVPQFRPMLNYWHNFGRVLLDFPWVCQRGGKVMHLSMSRWPGGGGARRDIGQDFDRSLWPGGRAFELCCCPGGRDIWIFVRARDHKSFPRRGISVIFELTVLPGGREFDSNLLENVKIPPYALPPPCRLHIDRCIMSNKFTCATLFWVESPTHKLHLSLNFRRGIT